MTRINQRKRLVKAVVALGLNLILLGGLTDFASAQTWSVVAEVRDRRGHTATLMGDGRILMAGGSGAADAQLIDPLTGGGPESTMNIAREGHTATLLPTGKVFVAGTELSTDGSTTEIYDPSTNTWSSATSMSANRGLHTATLLLNGKVLITGGCDALGSPLSSTEIYDPVTNSWSSAAAMSATRCLHTATLLSTGDVLVTGGFGLNSAEIYDPATNSWAPAASMSASRAGHTATLLSNGHVLVAGGPSASAEIYDPGTNTWGPAASMGTSRETHTATLSVNGLVLVAGGVDNSGDPLSSSEVYDPASNTWGIPAIMHVARVGHTATLLSNGTVLVAGGVGGITSSLEVFTFPGPVNRPDITVTPTSLDFGLVQLNSSAVQTVTVKNDGTVGLTTGNVTFGGANINQFSKAADKCSKKTLAPGASCTIDLRFKPTTIGVKTATFIIPSNDPDENPSGVPLGGTGVSRK